MQLNIDDTWIFAYLFNWMYSKWAQSKYSTTIKSLTISSYTDCVLLLIYLLKFSLSNTNETLQLDWKIKTIYIQLVVCTNNIQNT